MEKAVIAYSGDQEGNNKLQKVSYTSVQAEIGQRS